MISNLKEKKILIAGGTGLIGRHLARALQAQGAHVCILSRKKMEKSAYPVYLWRPDENWIEPGAMDQAYAVVQLAGESIAGPRWTTVYKEKIRSSRINSSRLLVDAMNQMAAPPAVFIGASAIGYYGHRPGVRLSEISPAANSDFMSTLCVEWESCYQNLRLQVRKTIIRIGLVLNTEDGILARSLWPAKLGFVPIFGAGDQMYPWIHWADLVSICIYLLSHNDCHGVYNATSPQPVPQKVFASCINHVLQRWRIPAPAPRWLLRLVLGEMANALFLSQAIYPDRIQEAGFAFQFPELVAALADCIRDESRISTY
jgi:uncharacterized protein